MGRFYDKCYTNCTWAYWNSLYLVSKANHLSFTIFDGHYDDPNWPDIGIQPVGGKFRQAPDIFARKLVLLILGLSFLVQGKTALVPIGIIWAVLGLWKTTDAFVDFWEAYQAKQGVLSALGELLIRLILSLLLLFDPYGKFTPHIAILGATLLLNAIFPERR